MSRTNKEHTYPRPPVDLSSSDVTGVVPPARGGFGTDMSVDPATGHSAVGLGIGTHVAAQVHTHAAGDTTSGVFPIARLATGTPDGTKYVRDDGTLQTPPGGGGDDVSVNSAACTDADFDDTTPAVPAGDLNIKWQSSGTSPTSVSGYVDISDLNHVGTGAPTTTIGKVWLDTDAAGSGVQTLSVVTKTGAYTATTSDAVILCDATSAAFSITLLTAVGNAGLVLHIKKTDSSANAVTIDGDGTETIDDSTTKVLASQYDAVRIVSDGTEWWIL